MAKKGRFITSYKIGQDNIQKWGLDMHNPVFFISENCVYSDNSAFRPLQGTVKKFSQRGEK